LAHARRVFAAHELDLHLGLDRLVEAHLEQVQVNQITAHRVALLLLDYPQLPVAAFQLQIEQRAASREDGADVARVRLEGARLLAAGVDDARDHALAAQAAGRARTELGALLNLECWTIGSHQRRMRIESPAANARGGLPDPLSIATMARVTGAER